jgi:hypothetical protein
MNRLQHLKLTLPRNIYDIREYRNAEIIILNYNSKDGLDNWMLKHYYNEVHGGLIKYYWTKVPTYFHMSHAKNMAHRIATGDVLCNVDADNYIGDGFCEYVNKEFTKNRNIILYAGTFGKIAMARENFMRLGGYDEQFIGWGYEDADMRRRAARLGLAQVNNFDNAKFKKRIDHSDALRIKHMVSKLNESRTYNKKLLEVHDKAGIITVNAGYEFGIDAHYDKRYGQVPQQA